MKLSVSRLAALPFAIAIFALALPAQQRPAPQQAQLLLQTRPELVEQLRQRLATSGLTPEQVRARLRAEGYPENLLDAYLTGGAAGTNSAPTDDVLNAMRALGISDASDVETLRTATAGQARPAPGTEGAKPADGTELFGLSLFRSVTTEFLPNADGPVDANYRLGPGDRLVLILTGDVELAHTLDVTREGFVVIPQVGQLQVTNLTMAQLDALMYTRLAKVYSGVKRGAGATTRFSVSVAKLRSNQVFVIGDVERPGSFRISSAGTALTALYAAGGPSDRGSLRKVTVRRSGKTVATLDVYDYLLRGDASADVRLENGDVVFVPVHGARVRATGEITRPATYELKEGETLADLVNAAGGFTAVAGRQRLQIERITPPAQRKSAGRDRVVVEVASDELAAGGVPALKIEAGDVVRVFPVSSRVRNRIAVNGNVWLPGTQGLGEGLTLSQALRRAGGAKPDSYLGQVLITRLEADSTRSQLRAVLRDTTGAVLGNDIALKDDDEIQLFSRTEFRPARFVAISGAVRKPGQYPYREGITLRDLVLLAGGLEERASVKEAEIARLPDDRSNGITARTMRVPLDSSYLFEHMAANQGVSNAAEVALRPYDNALILQQPDWRLPRSVVITGEVRSPGRYTIQNKSERISELVKRAGGLTNEGNSDGAYLTRRSGAASYRALSDSVRLRGDTATRVGVDLADIIRDPRSIDNLLLENGDSLDVPPHRATVEIRGAVNAPTIVALSPGKGLEHYIRAGGGGSRVAETGRAYVLQPNGKIESRHRILGIRVDPTPRAGATVIVPVKDTTEAKGTALQTFSIVTQMIAMLMTAIAVARK